MEFVNTAWALVSVLVAIVLALATKEVYLSLFVGIATGALLVSGFDPAAILDATVNDGLVPAVADNAGIDGGIICMIAPVSSRAAAVSGVAADLNVNGIQLFIEAIPFNFYSLPTIVFVVGFIFLNFDYGPMAKAELEAHRNGELGSLGKNEVVGSLIVLVLSFVYLLARRAITLKESSASFTASTPWFQPFSC